MAIIQALNDFVSMDTGTNQEKLLEMHAHRYLPNEMVVDFIEKGVKACNVKILSIENVLKPELVDNFEKRWRRMKKERGGQLAKPRVQKIPTYLNFRWLTMVLQRKILKAF